MQEVIIGIDEVGLGTLAGPCVVGVVVLPLGLDLPRVKDSKRMTVKSRESVIDLIHEKALFYKTYVVEASEIDRIGLGKCWVKLTQQAALEASQWAEKHKCSWKIIVDGNRLIPGIRCVPLVRADSLIPAVSAASVIAKYHQVCIMEVLDKEFPLFGFRSHHGYGSKAHLKALEVYGICREHRKTYKPIQDILSRSVGSSHG